MERYFVKPILEKAGISPDDDEYKTASTILKFYSSYKLVKSADGFAQKYKQLDIVKKIEESTPYLPKHSPFLDPNSKNIGALLRESNHFEQGLQEIENAFLHKQPFFQLPLKTQEDFASLIKQNNQGLVTGMHHMQNHHIMLKSEPDFQDLFARSGRSIIEDPANRILLPDSIGSNILQTDRTMHQGMHSKESYGKLLKDAQELLYLGGLESWSESKYSIEIDALLLPARTKLQNGATKLNNAKSILERIKEDAKK